MARLTLEQIGRIAGVSRSTVSRVINKQGDVSADVRQRVLDVIAETGFQPNRAARSLVSRRSGVLGLVIPSSVHSLFEDPYFGRLIQGITSAANEAEQTMTLFLFEDEAEEMDRYPRVMADGLLDGLIVTATHIGNPLVKRMMADTTNLVMVGRPDSGDIPCVDVDNRNGAAVATRHLLDHGYRDIALIAAPSDTTTGVDRRAGFGDAMTEAGIEVPASRMVEGAFTEASGFKAMEQLLIDPPQAVFCGSDTMALGAMRALTQAGLRCPDDIAITSFDGLVDNFPVTTPLTTIVQPVWEAGEEAVRLLLKVIAAGERLHERRLLPTELRVRASCGCFPPTP